MLYCQICHIFKVFFLGGGGLEIRIRQGLLILTSTGGVVLMPAFLKIIIKLFYEGSQYLGFSQTALHFCM